MVTTIQSLGRGGISGYEVDLECFLSSGCPVFDIVGLPGMAVNRSLPQPPAGGSSLV